MKRGCCHSKKGEWLGEEEISSEGGVGGGVAGLVEGRVCEEVGVKREGGRSESAAAVALGRAARRQRERRCVRRRGSLSPDRVFVRVCVAICVCRSGGGRRARARVMHATGKARGGWWCPPRTAAGRQHHKHECTRASGGLATGRSTERCRVASTGFGWPCATHGNRRHASGRVSDVRGVGGGGESKQRQKGE